MSDPRTDPRHAPLFAPLRIGPVTAPNRFCQVSHCNGGGHASPEAVAEMRRVKAEGGWGIIFTEQCEIDPASEISPFLELRLWDDGDIAPLALMAQAMKSHGALAGIELAHPGINGPNFHSREVPLAPMALPVRTFTPDPVQARAVDREDIRAIRRRFVAAARRAEAAGFDLVCLYGAHGFGIFQHFLSRALNQRTDEYGGSLANRARLLVETVAEVRAAVGDRLGITLRLSLDEPGPLGFSNAELRELVGLYPDLPDLWDFAHGAWEDCSQTSRFGREGGQEPLLAGLKALTPKPVMGVGRFTTPDTMARLVRERVLDLVGAARPSIADPFLPLKIREGRTDDIRECIGCNICVSGDMTMSLSRCTQNPSFMEEWRKGWHPERMNPRGSPARVLVVGAGPAGLEAALSLGRRGYEVALAEAGREPGGRVSRESALPGLAEWARVRDWRLHQIGKLPNVTLYRESRMTAADVLTFGAEHVAVATGALWRRDGVARQHTVPPPIDPAMPLFTPDDLMAGRVPAGEVLLWDDDHFYMGGVLAELLVRHGARVRLVTSAARVSDWTWYTLEQRAIHRRLAQLGVQIELNRGVAAIAADHVVTSCAFTGKEEPRQADAVVMVGARQPCDALARDLLACRPDWAAYGLKSVRTIGDAEAPGPIAWATYAGHRYARELDGPPATDPPAFRRARVALGAA
jgi:dimethylamine/trimethylamine dehydrogenase